MKALTAVIALAVGLLCIISPYTAWYLRDGWRYRDAEPSDFALGVIRGCGVVCVIFAAAIFFVL